MRWVDKKPFMPGNVLAEWEKICDLPVGSTRLQTIFKREAVALEGNSFDSHFFNKFRHVRNVPKWMWVSWKILAKEEGEDVAQEMDEKVATEIRDDKALRISLSDVMTRCVISPRFRWRRGGRKGRACGRGKCGASMTSQRPSLMQRSHWVRWFNMTRWMHCCALSSVQGQWRASPFQEG